MKKDKRFEITHSEDGFASSVKIVVDNETGVNYLYIQHGYSGGLTVLLDKDGKPVITKPDTSGTDSY